MAVRTFPERAEVTLMSCFGLSFFLIIQGYSKGLFQIGLTLLIISTLLEIGVGNLPTHAGAATSLRYMALFMSIIAAVFVLGILLVPYLTGLGR